MNRSNIIFSGTSVCLIIVGFDAIGTSTNETKSFGYNETDIGKLHLQYKFQISLGFSIFFMIIPTMVFVMEDYFNRIYEVEYLISRFSEKPDWKGHVTIALQILDSLAEPLTNQTTRYQCLANIFSFLYIIDVAIYSISYAIYMSYGAYKLAWCRWTHIACLVLSALLLLVTMVITNHEGARLKALSEHIYCEDRGKKTQESGQALAGGSTQNPSQATTEEATQNLSRITPARETRGSPSVASEDDKEIIMLYETRGWKEIINGYASYAEFYYFKASPLLLLTWIADVVLTWTLSLIKINVPLVSININGSMLYQDIY